MPLGLRNAFCWCAYSLLPNEFEPEYPYTLINSWVSKTVLILVDSAELTLLCAENNEKSLDFDRIPILPLSTVRHDSKKNQGLDIINRRVY